MITIEIHRNDISREVIINGGNISFNRSYIDVFPSNILYNSTQLTIDGFDFWIGEDIDPCGENFLSLDHSIETTEFDGYEGLRLQVKSAEGGQIVISRTMAGSSPLYVTEIGDCLVASWKFDEVVKHLSEIRPNIEICRTFLEHGQCQTREQIFHGLYMLWPGERLIFDRTGLTFQKAANLQIVQSSTLTNDARATDEFIALIRNAIERQIRKSNAPLIELSGGLDSTCVAIAVGNIRGRINTYSVIQRGIVGKQQSDRRKEIIKKFGFIDHEFPSYDMLPIDSLKLPECHLTLYDDYFRIPCVRAIDSHPTAGLDLVLTGIGGDELTKEDTFWRDEWEVPHIASSSALVSAVGRADMFMRRGIWPISPLVHPKIINFCRALPLQMRASRMLNLLTIARAGISDGFLFPRYTEHYGSLLSAEAFMIDYDEIFSTSAISDFGITRIDTILREARDATLDGFSWELISKLQRYTKLEYLLRAFIK